eukprot:scaffold42177_cov34-Prasinocladus_malaysianus.AAC.1
MAVEAVESVMRVYQSALQEFLAHVAVECRERALMLSILWDHFASLVVVRVRLSGQQREARAAREVSALERE